MRVLKIMISLTLGICALLIFLFGAQVIAVTVQVNGFQGNVDLTGTVEDESGKPLSNVTVKCDGSLSMTGEDGSFVIENVSLGMNEFTFYRPGYIGTRIGLLVYPEDDGWMGKNPDSSPNAEFVNDPVIMYDEIEWIEFDGSENHSVSSISNGNENKSGLTIELDRDSGTTPILIELFNGSGLQYSVLIDDGSEKISIIGNYSGAFDLRMSGEEILDIGIRNITLEPEKTLNIPLRVRDQGFIEYRSGLSVNANLILGSLYLVMGILIGSGTFISIRKGLWTPLIVLSILGFFARDPFGTTINIVSILSLVALICVIMMRKYTIRSYGPRINPAI